MDDFEFFFGERSFAVTVASHGGKVQRGYKLTERWQVILGRSLNCGLERTYSLKKHIGLTSTEREEIQSTISSSLGKEGVAQIKSEVKAKLGRELQLEVSQEEEDEITVKAPECGRVTLRVYQFVRDYEFTFVDKRFWLWRKKSFTRPWTEWLNYLHDRSIPIDFDAECNCKIEKKDDIEGLVTFAVGNMSWLSRYKHTSRGLTFPDLAMMLPGARVEDILFTYLALNREQLPDHIRFMAGNMPGVLSAQILPYTEGKTIRLSSEAVQQYERLKQKNADIFAG